jgi:hypothetical protein
MPLLGLHELLERLGRHDFYEFFAAKESTA